MSSMSFMASLFLYFVDTYSGTYNNSKNYMGKFTDNGPRGKGFSNFSDPYRVGVTNRVSINQSCKFCIKCSRDFSLSFRKSSRNFSIFSRKVVSTARKVDHLTEIDKEIHGAFVYNYGYFYEPARSALFDPRNYNCFYSAKKSYVSPSCIITIP